MWPISSFCIVFYIAVLCMLYSMHHNTWMNKWISERLYEWNNLAWADFLCRNYFKYNHTDISINQSMEQSINQSINQWINQSINQSIKQSINQSNNQSINKSVNHISLIQICSQYKWEAETDRQTKLTEFNVNYTLGNKWATYVYQITN